MLPLEAPPGPGAGALDVLGDLGAHAVGADLLQRVLQAVPARVVVLDAGECLVWANDEFFRFTQLHPKQVLGVPIARIIGESAHAAYGHARERVRRGETVAWEGWVDLHGVGRRYMREHLVPCLDAQGRHVATIAFSLDWTELRLREADLSAKVDQLQTTEALKSSIVDHALAAIVSTDEHGVVAEFNPAAEAMFRMPREAAVGRPVSEVLIPARHRAAHDAGMARMAAGGPPRVMGRRLEMEACRADGSEFPVEMVLWRTGVAGRAFYTASMFDLSERRAAQAEIERQREALRQSEKLTAMGSLLAGVAHELNNPLAIVMGRASLLEDKTEGTPLAGDAQRIREAAERCGRIVRTFLNMARQRPAQRAPVQLNDLARAAVDMLQYGLRSHGIDVVWLLDRALPPVVADADQIGQVVLNLVVNAQQALAVRDGARRLQLASGLDRSGAVPQVWLTVADNGPGVGTELAGRIFEPFFTTKAEGTGTGLGLAVSRTIAREHGGDVVLETPPGGGAAFRLQLPVEAPAGPQGPLPAAPAEAAPPAARVLVVDDEPEIADLIRAMLEDAGWEVAVAESGAVALAMLAEVRVDAIVSDLRMPDIDGAGLWREVRQRDPRLALRMVFVTGDTLSPAARAFLDEAGCPSLDKPFARRDLIDRVRSLLDRG